MGTVLPSIRRTGSYNHGSGATTTGATGHGQRVVDLPSYGRFTVMNFPNALNLMRSEWAISQDIAAIDCRILCHRIQLIEGFWHRYLQVSSTGRDYRDGFSHQGLGEAIREAGLLAERTLRDLDRIKAEQMQEHAGGSVSHKESQSAIPHFQSKKPACALNGGRHGRT